MDNTAWFRLLALQEHPPAVCDESAVLDFHEILTALEGVCGDLSKFRIPDDRLKQRPIGGRRASHSGRAPGDLYMSATRYCDDQFFRRQVHGAVTYVAACFTGAIERLSNAIGESRDVRDVDRKGLTETLAVVSKEVSSPPDQRRPGLLESSLRIITKSLSTANTLIPLLHDLLEKLRAAGIIN